MVAVTDSGLNALACSVLARWFAVFEPLRYIGRVTQTLITRRMGR